MSEQVFRVAKSREYTPAYKPLLDHEHVKKVCYSDENGYYFEYGCEYTKLAVDDFKEVSE